MAEYGSAEWYGEVEDRQQADLAAKAPRLRELKERYGVLDIHGRPTGKVLTDAERAALTAEADKIAQG